MAEQVTRNRAPAAAPPRLPPEGSLGVTKPAPRLQGLVRTPSGIMFVVEAGDGYTGDFAADLKRIRESFDADQIAALPLGCTVVRF